MTDSILVSTQRFTHTTFVPFAVPTEPLLDTYPDAAFAYSLRKLRSDYAGAAVRVRRDSDDGEADIGFTGSGDFDVAAAVAHIGGATGYIAIWYDQSGNAFDLPTTAEVNQHTFGTINSRSALSNNGSRELTSANVDLSTFLPLPVTIVAVLEQGGANARNGLFSWNRFDGANEVRLLLTYDDVLYFIYGDSGGAGAVSVAQPSGWDDNPHIVEAYRDSGDNQAIVVDGVSLVSATKTDTLSSASADTKVGNYFGNVFFGTYAELVAWNNEPDRAGIRANMNTYYTVY